MDPVLFTEYLKFLLKGDTEKELKERRERIALHIEGVDSAVRTVYRAIGEKTGLPESTYV